MAGETHIRIKGVLLFSPVKGALTLPTAVSTAFCRWDNTSRGPPKLLKTVP